AVLAQADLLPAFVQDREAHLAIGVHQRLNAQFGYRGADKGVLMRAGEDGPGDGVVDQLQLIQTAAAAVLQLQLVVTQFQALDQDLQLVVAGPYQGWSDFLVVDPELELLKLFLDDGRITFDGNQHITTADLVRCTREYRQAQVRSCLVLAAGAASSTQTPGQGDRQHAGPTEQPAALGR